MDTTETQIEPEFRSISNSEATDWATCKRKYLNAYVDRLAPKKYRGPIAIGLIGHMGLERYFKGRLAGESHEVARLGGKNVFTELLRSSELYDMKDILKAHTGYDMYMSYYGDEFDLFEIIAIEEKYNMPFPQRKNFDFAMRIDLLVRDKHTGEVILRDFKFTYDFWNQRKFLLRGQFPKYLLALRFNDVHVDKVVIDQIRYREMKDKDDYSKYLKRSNFNVTDVKIRNILRDHVSLSDQIMEFRSLSRKEQEKAATRLLVDPICKNCFFAELCEIELEGGNTEVYREEAFTLSTYGYNNDVELEVV